MFRIPFNRECSKCPLSSSKALAGYSVCPPKDVKLIIIKDNPTKTEENLNTPFFSNTFKYNSRSLTKEMSYGDFLKMSIYFNFNKDPEFPSELKPFDDFIYYTYAVKCNKKDKSIEESHRRKCREEWIFKELSYLPRHVPILLCGNHPVKSILGKDKNLYDCRNKDLLYEGHPVVVSNDLEEIERGRMNLLKHSEDEVIGDICSYLEYKKKIVPKDLDTLIETQLWKPTLVGQSMWFWQQDLARLKRLVLESL